MGTTQSYRLAYSPVYPGPPDINGRSTSKIDIDVITENYLAGVYINSEENYYPTQFTEYINGGTFYIDKNSTQAQSLDICVIDYEYWICSSLINAIKDINTGQNIPLSKIYFEPSNSSCFTLDSRYGSYRLSQPNLPIDTFTPGYLCKVSVKDYKETKEKQLACCKATHINFSLTNEMQPVKKIYDDFVNLSLTSAAAAQCPMVFSNGYVTDQCNSLMEEYCLTNGEKQECLIYMLAQVYRSKTTINTFINHCSKNLNDRTCMFMAIALREYGNSGAADQVIKTYCDNNPADKKCKCYNTIKELPAAFKDNAYIGPIACWYKPCAEEVSLQFLLTEQLTQRSKCKLTLCKIDIGNIAELKDQSLIKLINNCSENNSSVKLPTSDKYFDNDIWSPGNMGLLTLSLSSFIVIGVTAIIAVKWNRNK